MESVLLICRDKDAVQAVVSAFAPECRVDNVVNPSRALGMLKKVAYEFVFVDLDILEAAYPEMPAAAAMAAFRKACGGARMVVLTLKGRVPGMAGAGTPAAGDYLSYPVEPGEVSSVVSRRKDSLMMASELAYPDDRDLAAGVHELVHSQNPRMIHVFRNIRMAAPTRTPILLVGETGVGKGVLARLIHRQSHRKDAHFISVHCGAIPETLIENELFGHEKGAFTGAGRRKLGKFEIANDGTIFLDEIGTITPLIQIKLLQVLQDGTFSRLGGEEELRTEARVITATNADLKRMSREGQFRKDLYYRLNVFPIEIPPLRERALEDIPVFVDMFLKKLNRLYRKGIEDVHPMVIDALMNYSWPGNIRELENLIERAYIVESGRQLTAESFSVDLTGEPVRSGDGNADSTLAAGRRRAVEMFERRYLSALLTRHRGRVGAAAADAGISTRQLNKLMIKYGFRKEAFKSP